eukprot:COSAG02_NODE_209_length_28965_cov_18.680143_27_plen_83_part_00
MRARLQDEVKDQKIQLAEKKARVEAKKDILKRKRQQENLIAELTQLQQQCVDEFAENKRVRSACCGKRPLHILTALCAVETR